MISGQVTNYKSYELANSMAKGAAFNWDNCCRIRFIIYFISLRDLYILNHAMPKWENMKAPWKHGMLMVQYLIWDNVVNADNEKSVYG